MAINPQLIDDVGNLAIDTTKFALGDKAKLLEAIKEKLETQFALDIPIEENIQDPEIRELIAEKRRKEIELRTQQILAQMENDADSDGTPVNTNQDQVSSLDGFSLPEVKLPDSPDKPVKKEEKKPLQKLQRNKLHRNSQHNSLARLQEMLKEPSERE